VVTATSRTVALPVAASSLTAGLGLGAIVMVFLRMVFQPGANEFIELRFGIWLALISSAVIAYGGWEAMREEGTTFDDARDQLRTRMQGGEPAAPAPGPAASTEPSAEPLPESERSKPPPHPAP
jgi:hypothetical protein